MSVQNLLTVRSFMTTPLLLVIALLCVMTAAMMIAERSIMTLLQEVRAINNQRGQHLDQVEKITFASSTLVHDQSA